MTVKIDNQVYEKIEEDMVIKYELHKTDHTKRKIYISLEKSSDITAKLFNLPPEVLASDFIDVTC